ncbi:c-type cytochrome [Hymenobacter sp. BRD67]|nr:c-type cytochrome [Hymenobacter sp. BRD67]
MKKIGRWLSLFAGLLVLAVAGFAAYVDARGVPTYPAPAVGKVLPSTPDRLAHGEQLAAMMCVHCHRDPATNTLSGRALPEVGSDLGRLHSANITQDPVYGVGKWTDAQLVGLLRTGIGADGRMRLVMPHFAYLSEEDAASLVAFLRSGDALVRAMPSAHGPQQVSFLGQGTHEHGNEAYAPACAPCRSAVGQQSRSPGSLPGGGPLPVLLLPLPQLQHPQPNPPWAVAELPRRG